MILKEFILPEADHASYASAKPFPHAVFDGVLRFAGDVAVAALGFIDKGVQGAYSYDNALERKRAEDRIDRLHAFVRDPLVEMNSPAFLQWLERLTGIEGLIPDPYYRGGGLHLIPPGGKLDVHIDYNVHPILKLDRRVNVLVYLNREWRPERGGALELWHGETQERIDGMLERRLISREASILPELGRMVVFTTSEASYHGHPEPTVDRWRLSLSTYYYTAVRWADPIRPAHSTAFVARPGDPPDPEADRLRELRARGRVASPVRVEGRKD